MSTKIAKRKRTQENADSYCEGGYHPVKIGDLYHGRYTILQKLGWGKFSTVWLSWDQRNTKFVALKIVRSADVYRHAALREIQFLKCTKRCKSNDPHKVVKLLDNFSISGVNGSHICMVFEALGPNLKEMIKRAGKKRIPLTTVKCILRQILQTLDYLHTTCNIIHTDIKPENICVDENKMCKLAYEKWEKEGKKFIFQEKMDTGHEVSVTLGDLGNACWLDGHFCDVIQTRQYRSPEVVLGGEYRANADVWSMACVAFELATGRCLFPLISRNMNKSYSEDEYHLALITRLLGDIPEGMAFASFVSRGFFTEECKLLFSLNFDSCGLVEKLTRQFEWDESEAHRFAQFLLPMLAIDPNDRCSAKDCLGHKWLELL